MRVVAFALAALLLASCSGTQPDPQYKLARICSERDYVFIGPTGRFYLSNVRHIYTYADGTISTDNYYVEQLPEGTTPDSLCGSK